MVGRHAQDGAQLGDEQLGMTQAETDTTHAGGTDCPRGTVGRKAERLVGAQASSVRTTSGRPARLSAIVR